VDNHLKCISRAPNQYKYTIIKFQISMIVITPAIESAKACLASPDPRGSHSNESDGYLAPLPSPSEKYWADYRAGSESGEGRLEKLHSRK
jgi:hypothetical protein